MVSLYYSFNIATQIMEILHGTATSIAKLKNLSSKQKQALRTIPITTSHFEDENHKELCQDNVINIQRISTLRKQNNNGEQLLSRNIMEKEKSFINNWHILENLGI